MNGRELGLSLADSNSSGYTHRHRHYEGAGRVYTTVKEPQKNGEIEKSSATMPAIPVFHVTVDMRYRIHQSLIPVVTFLTP